MKHKVLERKSNLRHSLSRRYLIIHLQLRHNHIDLSEALAGSTFRCWIGLDTHQDIQKIHNNFFFFSLTVR